MTEEQQTLLDDCEARKARLSDEDRATLASLRAALEGGLMLTRKQADALDDIWAQCTERG